MKKEIKTTLSKSVTALLNRTLTSSANASSSFLFNQPVEPSSLKKFKKAR
ncbi:MAG: AgrD family cyclic lactone autoinducer peptide [Lachnospira eligens]